MGGLHKFVRLIELRRLVAASLAFVVFDAGAADTPDIPAIMRSTVDWWIASQSDGFVPYGYDFLSDKALEPDRMSAPNLIRQTGMAFAAAGYYEYTSDSRLREPIRASLMALRRLSIPISKGRLQRLVESARIYSVPAGRWKVKSALDRMGLLYQTSGDGKVVSPNGKYDGALSGNVALALLTEVIYAGASADETFADDRRSWLKGLLSLRIPGGGFRQLPVGIDDSDYDNGEGWLALAVYVDKHRDDLETAAALEDLDRAMLTRYSEEPSLSFFGWGSMASAQRFTTTKDPKFLAYLRRQGDVFNERFRRKMRPEDNNCGTLEGASAMLAVLVASGESDSDRVRNLRSWISQEIAKLPRLQIQPRQKDMALMGQAHLTAPAMASFAGGFLWSVREPTTRVDAAGHCLSAMVNISRAGLH